MTFGEVLNPDERIPGELATHIRRPVAHLRAQPAGNWTATSCLGSHPLTHSFDSVRVKIPDRAGNATYRPGGLIGHLLFSGGGGLCAPGGSRSRRRTAWKAALIARGHGFSTTAEIGAATGIAFLPGGVRVAAADRPAEAEAVPWSSSPRKDQPPMERCPKASRSPSGSRARC